MAERQPGERIRWYRTPVDPKLMAQLNKRSDVRGMIQAGGHLLLIASTGTLAYFAIGRWPLPLVLLILFIHGTIFAFIPNAGHELVHKTVFKTRWLNTFFLKIYSFLGWYNHHYYWTSHQEHHKYTLHPPDDLEVVMPREDTILGFVSHGFVNVMGFYRRMVSVTRMSLGYVDGEWANHLFPSESVKKRTALRNWARIMLVGHVLLTVVSLALDLWKIPLLVSLAPFYGSIIQLLTNEAQHSGLPSHQSDFRINSRTIYLGPILSFLYWNMNYHVEHHMYAAVPFYNLPKLHEAIKHDLPPTPNGLIQTWREILPILRRQKAEPSYRYMPPIPNSAR